MKKNAFTLVEVLVAVMLVGLAIACLLAASSSFTSSNAAGMDLSTAEFLTEQIRELTALLPAIDPNTGTDLFGPEEAALADYDDLDDFDGASFCPPINANRQPLDNFAAFSQQVAVENVNPADFEQVVGDHTSDFVRVTVKVCLNAREITSTRWLRASLDN